MFNEILNQAVTILQQHGRVSYRALKRQFDLDDPDLKDLTDELIEIHQVASDQDGKNAGIDWRIGRSGF